MVQAQGVATGVDPRTQRSLQALAVYCLSYGCQRLTFFILATISVFYFTHDVAHDNKSLGQLYSSFFLAALYLSPVVVAVFVHTLPKQRASVYCGLIFMIAACISLAIGKAAVAAAVLLFAGVGLFSANFRAVFDDSLWGGGAANLTWLYLAGNVGSVAARLIVRDSVQTVGPSRTEFLWCVGSLCAALILWWLAQSRPRTNGDQEVEASDLAARSKQPGPFYQSSPVSIARKNASKPLFPLVVTGFAVLFWLGFNLKVGRVTLDAMDRIRDTWLGIRVVAFRLQIVNPLVTALLGGIFAREWRSLSRRGRDPHPATKMSIGLLCLGAGLLIWASGLAEWTPTAQISAGWLVGMYVFHSVGELLFEPVGQKFILSNSPRDKKAFFLSIWDAAESVAYACGGAAAFLFKTDLLYWLIGFGAVGSSMVLLTLKGRLSRGDD